MPILPTIRHQRIIELLAEREYITIIEVCKATGASMATTHRDLARLATAGRLTRVRGGATRPPAPRGEARLLAVCVARVCRALDKQDLDAVEHALHQALNACELVRRSAAVLRLPLPPPRACDCHRNEIGAPQGPPSGPR